jgi:hypothetical protein
VSGVNIMILQRRLGQASACANVRFGNHVSDPDETLIANSASAQALMIQE